MFFSIKEIPFFFTLFVTLKNCRTIIMAALYRLLLILSLLSLSMAELQVLIAGPTRSGTSFLAYVVQQLGFQGGHVHAQPVTHQVSTIKGTHENGKLMHQEDRLLHYLHASVNKPPVALPDKETQEQFCEGVQRIVKEEGVEFYKSNRAPVIADLWHHCYPNIKWIWIQRNFEDRYQSRDRFMGQHKNDNAAFKAAHAAVLQAWTHSLPASKALHLTFEEFDSREGRERAFRRIASFLSVPLSDALLTTLHTLYRPVLQEGSSRSRQFIS